MSTALTAYSWRFRVARAIAIGFGAGASPVAPGTTGSLVGLALGAALMCASPLALLAGVLIATYGGLWAIRVATGLPWRSSDEADRADPGWIVIDEIAGQMLAMLALHHLSLTGAALVFALFRLFDIAKPGPIGWADRQPGAAGIMADDLLAGGCAAVILVLARVILHVPV